MNKEILRLAIPNIVSNIAIPMHSTIDTIIMGRFSAKHIAAIGIGSMMFNFIYWNFGFLRMSTTGLTAQAFGMKDEGQIANHLGRGIFLALSIGLLLIIFQNYISALGLDRLDTGETEVALVREYFHVRIWAAPASLCMYALMGWLFGMQNSIVPLVLTIFSIILNIALNIIFVFYLDYEVAGLALGTVIAQYITLLAAFIYLLTSHNRFLKKAMSKMIFQLKELLDFMRLNFEIFIRTLCLTIVFWKFHEYSAELGTTILAVNVILLQFVNWMSYGVDGFAFAAESVVGKYKGGSNPSKLKWAVKLCFIWGLVLALIFSAVYGFFGESMLNVFTNEEDLIEASLPFMRWMIFIPIVASASYVWDGVFVGLTASKSMLVSMLISFLLFVFLVENLMLSYSNNGLWLALFLFLAARGIIQTVMYWKKGLALK